MFAVINHLSLTTSVDEIGTRIINEGLSVLSKNKGFKDFYFVKEAEKKGCVIILWETAEDAVNGAKQFGPTWFTSNIKPFLSGEEGRSVGPVIVKYNE